jgi:flavin reductase (DIM6/NTAB) family NADH-FMN oxidoreductase RutF
MVIDPKTLSSRETYNLLVGAVVPRPIAFITSINEHGTVNAAPYSFFNAIASSPPLVILSVTRKNGAMKHTAENILHAKEFVVNIVTEQLLQSMNISSGDFPPEISEIEQSNLTLAPSISIRTPRIAESPVNFECALHRHLEVGNEPVDLIIGEIVQFHVKDELYSLGAIDQKSLRPIARMGGKYYATIENLFEMDQHQFNRKRPGDAKDSETGR